MNRDTETNEYRFNEAKHLHQLLVDGEWKNLTGCTTILSVLAKPALIQWSANMAVEFVEQNIITEFSKDENFRFETKSLDELLKEAKNAHRKKKEKAGDLGTQIHAEVERYIKYCIDNNDGIAVGLEVYNPLELHNS